MAPSKFKMSQLLAEKEKKDQATTTTTVNVVSMSTTPITPQMKAINTIVMKKTHISRKRPQTEGANYEYIQINFDEGHQANLARSDGKIAH